jgi:hypothetical protein
MGASNTHAPLVVAGTLTIATGMSTIPPHTTPPHHYRPGREEGQGYVCCGRLVYLGHDPSRIPIRFVWELEEFEALQKHKPFKSLVKSCNAMFKKK